MLSQFHICPLCSLPGLQFFSMVMSSIVCYSPHDNLRDSLYKRMWLYDIYVLCFLWRVPDWSFITIYRRRPIICSVWLGLLHSDRKQISEIKKYGLSWQALLTHLRVIADQRFVAYAEKAVTYSRICHCWFGEHTCSVTLSFMDSNGLRGSFEPTAWPLLHAKPKMVRDVVATDSFDVFERKGTIWPYLTNCTTIISTLACSPFPDSREPWKSGLTTGI